jgi:hypothetical protein
MDTRRRKQNSAHGERNEMTNEEETRRGDTWVKQRSTNGERNEEGESPGQRKEAKKNKVEREASEERRRMEKCRRKGDNRAL